jgi:Putative zinc-finger
MDEDYLRELIRLRKAGPGRKGWRCPGPATIAAYADGRLEEKSRVRLETHFADCDDCLNELAVLVQGRESGNEWDASPAMLERALALPGAKTSLTWKSAWEWTAFSAAAVLLVLVISVTLREPRTIPLPSTSPAATAGRGAPTRPSASEPGAPIPPSVRSVPRESALPKLTFPSEGATIPWENMEFRWRGVNGSIGYDVLVVTAEGDLVWEKRAEGTHTQLPRDVSLNSGQKYFVWVRAYLPDGKTVASPAVSFRTLRR